MKDLRYRYQRFSLENYIEVKLYPCTKIEKSMSNNQIKIQIEFK